MLLMIKVTSMYRAKQVASKTVALTFSYRPKIRVSKRCLVTNQLCSEERLPQNINERENVYFMITPRFQKTACL